VATCRPLFGHEVDAAVQCQCVDHGITL
jgi:hypothetical protein